jgi:hypothetical protein
MSAGETFRGPQVGVNNVGSYQVSGRPFQAGGAVADGVANEVMVEFPAVAKSITIVNRTANTIRVHFASAVTYPGVYANHRYTQVVGNNAAITLDNKCRRIWISNVSGVAGAYELFAELTGIVQDYAPTGVGITE